jgi:hypothetical protein
MIRLAFTVNDVNTVVQIYDYIEVAMSNTQSAQPADLTNYTLFSGTQAVPINGHPLPLVTGVTQYTLIDGDGTAQDWYMSRYVNYTTSAYSGWSEPVLGEPGDLFYNPLFPPEIAYGTEDQLIIDRIRRLIGDPLGLRREYGDEAASSIHFDNKTYELDEKGWPVAVTMAGTQMNDSTDPTINGYRYLRFSQDIATTTWSGGIEYGVDIWYYTFRWADREIMTAYDNCPPPLGLTTVTATSEAYMLQTAVELLYSEVWHDSGEDGARLSDEGSKYDPSPGLEARRKLLDDIQRRLDKIIQSLILTGVEGVLID